MLASYVQFYPRFLFPLVTSTLHDRGTWKTSTFKKYNFDAEGIPTNGGALHPLLKVREEIRNIFLEMGSVNNERRMNITNSDMELALPKCPLHLSSSPVSGVSMPFSSPSNTLLVNCKTLSTCLVCYLKFLRDSPTRSLMQEVQIHRKHSLRNRTTIRQFLPCMSTEALARLAIAHLGRMRNPASYFCAPIPQLLLRTCSTSWPRSVAER